MIATAVPRTPLTCAVETALRAPSVHNTQPWRWRIGSAAVQLHADPLRHLPATDPGRRDLLISCGAALHHLRVALAGAGSAAEVLRMPDPEDRDHLAAVHPVPGPPDPELVALAPAIAERRTDRRRLSRRPVPGDLLATLVGRAAAQGALLVPVVDEGRRDRLLATMAEAAVLQRAVPGYAAELQQWTHRYAHAHDGVRAAAVAPPPTGTAMPSPQRRFGPTGLAPAPARPGRHPDVDDGSVFLVLATAGDAGIDRLRAGEAASAVLLAATSAGLASTPFSQAVEVDESRLRLHHDVLRRPETPQLVLRVGWPATGATPLPPTPRRPLRAVLLG